MKYTDRDVREDSQLTQLAIAYIANYTGEFEPLVDAKELFEEEGELPVAVIRKVLNCMRHDAQVALNLPRPRYGSNVIQMVPPKRRKRVEYNDEHCGSAVPHYYHSWGDDNEHRCEGSPWPINRYEKRLPVKVKTPYAASRTGKLIHDIDPAGQHQGIWQGPSHAWGFRTQERGYNFYTADADLVVKLRCKFPSWLRNPILIKEDQLEQFMQIEDVIQGMREMSMCPHCAKLRG
jgi:hypothetical protein